MAEPQKSSFKVNDESYPEGHWQGKYEDFQKLGDGLDIDTFSKSADPYSKAQGMLMATYEELSTQAYTLANLWQGKASVEFQKNLKALYESACSLADATGQVNVAIGYHASDLQTLKENVDKMKPDTSESAGDWFFGDSYDPLGISHRTTDAEQHQNQANQQVQDWINKDLTHNTTTYTFGELPKSVHLEIPNPTPGAYNPTATPTGKHGPGSVGSPGGGGGGMPHMTPPGSHVTPPNSHFTPPNSHLTTPSSHTHVPDPTTLNHPPSSDLSGLSTHTPTGPGGPGLSDGLGLGGGGGGGGGLGGLGSHGGGLGGGGLGGGGMGGLGSHGTGSASGLGGMSAEEAAAARAAGAGKAAGANGGMPMGMGGGAGGGQEQERERTTWLTEDEDVWGGDGDVAPPVIG
jgi:uncharacterized protein YukE